MTYKIVVSKGSFHSVEEAACGEKLISWADFSNEDCRACTECFAAVDAKAILEEKKNLKVELCDLNCLPSEEGTVIFLGEDCAKFAAEQYGLPYERIEEEDSFRMYGTKRDGFNVALIYGGARSGSAYGMIEYLEYHGIRFIAPGEENIIYSKEYDHSEKEEFEITKTPSYQVREAKSEFLMDEKEDIIMWAYHARINHFFLMNVNKRELFHKLCLNIVGGGHTIWYKYMDVNQEYPYKHAIFGGEGKPEDPYEVSPLFKGDVNGDGILSYGEAHPEWFAEVDGVRTLNRDYDLFERLSYATGDFICTTNEEGTNEFIKLMLQTLIDGENRSVTNFKLEGLDNGTWCQCEKCRQDGTYSYKLLMLAYKLDKAIKQATEEGKIKRRIRVEIPAYHETLPPPDRALPEDFDYSNIYVTFCVIERCYVHTINDPKCLETNKPLCDNLLAWTNGYYQGEIMITEYFNVSSFAGMPFVLTDKIKNDMVFYYNIGVRHFVYMHILGRNWGVQAINNYLYGKLMWDVNDDSDKLVEEYFNVRYGEYSEQMKAVYQELEDAGSNCKYIKHYQWLDGKTRSLCRSLNKEDTVFFPLKHCNLDYREDDVQAGPSLLETAERYQACFDGFKEFVKDRETHALTEDLEQLEYGVYTLWYLYYKSLEAVRGDISASEKANMFAEKLEQITGPLLGYDMGDRFANGLSALAMHEQKSKK